MSEQMNWHCPNLISDLFLFTCLLLLLTVAILNILQFFEHKCSLNRDQSLPVRLLCASLVMESNIMSTV